MGVYQARSQLDPGFMKCIINIGIGGVKIVWSTVIEHLK